MPWDDNIAQAWRSVDRIRRFRARRDKLLGRRRGARLALHLLLAAMVGSRQFNHLLCDFQKGIQDQHVDQGPRVVSSGRIRDQSPPSPMTFFLRRVFRLSSSRRWPGPRPFSCHQFVRNSETSCAPLIGRRKTTSRRLSLGLDIPVGRSAAICRRGGPCRAQNYAFVEDSISRHHAPLLAHICGRRALTPEDIKNLSS